MNIFSTLGESANAVGVSGRALRMEGVYLTRNGVFMGAIDKHSYEIKLASNIVGGADIEDKESIRINAPAVTSTLDRLVTKKDYSSFIRTLSKPIRIRYGVAWGESEEIRRLHEISQTFSLGLKEMFNVAIVSGLGSLYKSVNNNWSTEKVLRNGGSLYFDNDSVQNVFINGLDGYDELTSETAFTQLFVQNKINNLMEYQYTANEGIKKFVGEIKKAFAGYCEKYLYTTYYSGV